MRLLLLDDEIEVKAFVERAMPEGSVLDYAANLVEAEQYVLSREYDLILTDLRMPGTTNGDALNRVLELCPGTAVMVLTGLHFPNYGSSLILNGATMVHFKPDSSMEPEIADRLLGEAILFTHANHEAHQRALKSQTAQVEVIERMQRELRTLQQERSKLAVVERDLAETSEELRSLRARLDAEQAEKARLAELQAQQAQQAAAMATQQAQQATNKRNLIAVIITAISALATAILAPIVAGRWGRP